jgi:erythromycin esterase
MFTLALLIACAQATPATPSESEQLVVEWLRTVAVSIPEREPVPTAIDKVFADVRVVGLGEATHGQHESFELKRKLTMHFVRKHGFRIVAYEASSALARACDDYVAGRSADANAALRGLGMMIWMIQENAALLDELRAWNASAAPADRVRFVGVDVQDAVATCDRLHALLEAPAPELAARAKPLGQRIEDARTTLYSGDAVPFDTLWAEIEALRTDVESAQKDLTSKSSSAVATESLSRARDLSRCMSAARMAPGRDQAMAEVLLEELARDGESARAVLWAHNGHVTKGPLRYMQIEDPGMGGVLRKSLGDRYYSVGFLFGAGEFSALANDPQHGWRFQSYAIPDAPPGSLEAPFVAAELGTAFVDLRSAPATGPLARWLDEGHGQRWFGGYNIPKDVETTSRDVSTLQATFARTDFDGLMYLARTTSSRPVGAR